MKRVKFTRLQREEIRRRIEIRKTTLFEYPELSMPFENKKNLKSLTWKILLNCGVFNEAEVKFLIRELKEAALFKTRGELLSINNGLRKLNK